MTVASGRASFTPKAAPSPKPRPRERGEPPVQRVLVHDHRALVDELADAPRRPREADRRRARLPQRRLVPRRLTLAMLGDDALATAAHRLPIGVTPYGLREQRQRRPRRGNDRHVARIAAHRVAREEGIDAEVDDGRARRRLLEVWIA